MNYVGLESDLLPTQNSPRKIVNRRRLITAVLSFAGFAPTSIHLIDLATAAPRHDRADANINQNEKLEIAEEFRRTEIDFKSREPLGSIIVDPHSKYLYFIHAEDRAIRYGVGVGRQGFEWKGEAIIRRKAKWPRWTPPKRMVKRDAFAAKWSKGMPGGLENPLGARALYLFKGDVDTLYRIHGTTQPQSIGTATSSGCIRLINSEISDLYDRVKVGAKVVVTSKPLPPERFQAPLSNDTFSRGLY